MTPDERAYFSRKDCVAVSETILSAGMNLPSHPFFRYILRQYDLTPTQLLLNAWN